MIIPIPKISSTIGNNPRLLLLNRYLQLNLFQQPLKKPLANTSCLQLKKFLQMDYFSSKSQHIILFLFYEGVVCNFKVFKKDLSNIQYFFTVQVLTVDYISVKTAAVVQHSRSSASWLSDSRPASQPTSSQATRGHAHTQYHQCQCQSTSRPALAISGRPCRLFGQYITPPPLK